MAGFPGPEALPNAIIEKFKQNIIGEYKTKIEEAVRLAVPLVRVNIPLASLLVSRTKPLRAVLPLRWDQYRGLGRANFKVVCEWSRHGGIELFSHSTKQCAHFPSPTNAFDAVEVEDDHDTIYQRLSNLRQLTVNEIYLQEHKWEPTFDCGQPDHDMAPQ